MAWALVALVAWAWVVAGVAMVVAVRVVEVVAAAA